MTKGELRTTERTLVEVLRAHLGRQPRKAAFSFLADGESETGRLTYEELDRRARAVAVVLARRGLAGERALLLYPSGLEFVVAFLGCLYSGTIAVPAHPPRRGHGADRYRALLHDAQPAVILTAERARLRGGGLDSDASALPCGLLATDDIDPALAGSWVEPEADPNAVAFLQYTSGSTTSPRGVMVRHRDLAANQRMIQRAFEQDDDSVVVGWLPLFHDMGLIGNVLNPLFVGASCVLMSPGAFLQRPVRWLQAVTRYRATTSGGPNFAYRLCVDRIQQPADQGLDLSSWRLAFNGAEPVRSETMERFTEAFAPCGFRAEAHYPCYGLAEATLFVTGGSAAQRPVTRRVDARALEEGNVIPVAKSRPGRSVVSCGRPQPEQGILVVDPHSRRPVPPGRVGEIWISGEGVAEGYWRRPEESLEVFGATLAGGVDPYLRTGDLGFLAGGELYVTGRLKDLIILRGRNHYPQDVELTAERSHPDLQPGGGAAFAVEHRGEERLVLVHEVRRRRRKVDSEAVVNAIRREVARRHDVQVSSVVLIRAGTLLKTTSGKVRRRACRQAYLGGELKVVASSDSPPAADRPEGGAGGAAAFLDPDGGSGVDERLVRHVVAAALGRSPEEVARRRPLTELGLDSLRAAEVSGRIRNELGVALPAADLLDGRSLDDLIRQLPEQPPIPAELPGVGPTPRQGERLPLSEGQRALWLAGRGAPGTALYNVGTALRILSPLDSSILERAVRRLTDRHEALRTTFGEHEGVPWQQVGTGPAPAVTVARLTGEGTRELEERLAQEARKPFDLERGPLWRVSVLQPAGDRRPVVLLAAHHLVADLWSLSLLLGELGDLYRQMEQGRPAARPPPASRYADFVRWQRRRLDGEEGAKLWEYWSRRLRPPRQELDLHTDRPRPARQSFAAAAEGRRLSRHLLDRLQDWGRGQGATLFMLLLAAFQTLLHRYTGQTDLSLGSPAAGRTAPGSEAVIGYFVNLLVMRADFAGEPDFQQVLDRTRRAVLGAFAHQDLPFPLLVERLQPERDPGRPPLVQVLFALQSTPPGSAGGLGALALGEEGVPISLGDLDTESVRLPVWSSEFDLALLTAETPGGLVMSLRFNRDLFDRSTVTRMLSHLAVLLGGVVAEPRRPVASLPLLTAAEGHQLEREWSGAEEPADDLPCLHESVVAQARRTPETVAVEWTDHHLSYGWLDARSAGLAVRLRSQGAAPEVLVALLVRRSAAMVLAVLGILRSGAAYLALDPSYPRRRLGAMLHDSGAGLVLAQQDLLALLPRRRPPVVPLGDGAQLSTGAGPLPPVGPARARHLAYALYTSGSTGRPKGVAIEHRGAAALLRWAESEFDRTEMSGVLAATSLCFDLSVFELFVPLSRGGRVIVVESALDLPSAGSRVRLLNTVPSVAAALVRDGRLPDAVRTVNLAGEALGRPMVERLYDRSAVERVRNLYGPSEDTTYSTWARIARGSPGEPAIGRPVTGTRAHLLDRSGQPVPAGLPAELYLGGSGLARGYLGRPALTAASFVPDPFSIAGGRLYRTGDRVRYRPDGQLQFLGRADRQVKLRGFRIELAEVEAALERHPAVERAAVLLGEGGAEGALAAFVTCGPATPPGVAELRRFLSRSLPAAFVPTRWRILQELPLTSTGKVDRRRLQEGPAAPAAAEKAGVAPRTPVEEGMTAIWREVLSEDRIGVHDDFFAAGGHSLKASRVAARIRDRFGVALTLADLFETPTVAGLARQVEARLGEGPELPPIRPAANTGEWPLAFPQQRLWFLERLHPGTAVHNVPLAVELQGDLNAPILETSLATLVRRHRALRTALREVEGSPVQVILDEAGPGLARVDLSGLAVAGQRDACRRLSRLEAGRPFDLEQGAPMRCRLLACGPHRHLLLLTLHHAACDGWSLRLLMGELTALYASSVDGGGEPVAELPVEYTDFAVWQRHLLEPLVRTHQLPYWRRRLQGLPPLALPTDRPSPAAVSFAGAVHHLTWPPGLAAAVDGLGRRCGASLFMGLLSGLAAQLARTCRQRDFAVGTPVANRGQTEIEGVIGFFANTLVLRCPVPPGTTFSELLEGVRETALGAYGRQELPFELLVQEIDPERSLGRNPLFQVLLSLDGAAGSTTAGGLRWTPREVHSGSAKFDLSFFLCRRGDDLEGHVEYREDLFDATTIHRLAAHLSTLLAAAVEQPEVPLDELSTLGASERHQLLVEWNDTGGVPGEGLLHGGFEIQAGRCCDAVALVAGGDHWSYAGLDAMASCAAANLTAAGVGPEDRVGLLLPRTPWLVASMLGILKAGAAYLPLDPAYPSERLCQLTRDAAAVLLLAEGSAGEEGEAGLPPVLPLAALRRSSGHRVVPSRPDGSCLAYVIYTSGSTGRPKGVAIEHRSAAARVRWAGHAFTRRELAAVLFATSVSFDLSVFELFGPLSHGGTAILADHALAWPHLPAVGRVTLVNTVPSVMAELVREERLPPSVRTVCLAGEPLPRRLATRVHRRGEIDRLLNLYGPSEDTTYSTMAVVAAADPTAPPIGRPLPATRARVLDPGLRPVPVGVEGELCLAGAGLARGYLGQPAPTAERFVPDPFAGAGGQRLYRTGDRVRRRADGRLDFLGRYDDQVKLRGFRIEPGEIEAALAAHPAVESCAVVTREVTPDQAGLVAYWTAADRRPTGAELEAHLRRRLPSHMVPAAFVALPRLPRTATGKLDRRALPAPRRPAGSGPAAPRSPAGEVVAGIWCDLLGREEVGAEADFFALGGHSLLAARMVARIERHLGVGLPLHQVFTTPSLAALTAAVEGAARQGLPPGPRVRPGRRRGLLPLSFPQERLWFLDRLSPGSAAYNLGASSILRGRLRLPALSRALNEIRRRHDVLRTRFVVHGDRPAQEIAPAQPRPLPLADLRGLAEEDREGEIRRLARRALAHPFDLARGPLLRCLLVRSGRDVHALLISLHHAVCDGWSRGVFWRELGLLYRAYAEGEPSPLAPLPVQYADFASWQRRWLESEAAALQLAYWRRQLDGLPPVLDLPSDRPRPAVQSFRGARLPVALDEALRRQAVAVGRRCGATLFMTLAAAWASLLHRHTGCREIVLGTPIANRDSATEGLIGYFANTLVLRLDVGGDPPFDALLTRTRETALAAYRHQDLPFETLVEALRPERDLSRNPLFQVLLGLDDAPREPLRLPGLEVETLAVEGTASRFDLALDLEPVAGGLGGRVELSTDLFDRTTIGRMIGHFRTLLRAAVEEPSTRLDALPLLQATERHQLLVEWNAVPGDHAAGGLLHDLVARQARQRPDAAAVVGDGEALTYGELARKARLLARRLADRGVGVETPVAVCLGRSPALVVALLGVLRAGGAYVPVDPHYPADRRAFMLRDAGAVVLLTRRGEAERPGAGEGGSLPVVLADDEGQPAGKGKQGRGAAVQPGNLAYVIYTSGSTGRPKGVAIEHRRVAHLVTSTRGRFGFGPEDTWTVVHTFAFDFSVWEIWSPLAHGGRLVIVPRRTTRSPERLLRLLLEQRVTVLNQTPSALRHLLEARRQHPRPWPVRFVVCGGEALPPDLAFRLAGLGTAVWNFYGPTESTVWATAGAVSREAAPRERAEPIGRPLAGRRLYALDRGMRPAAPGVPAELCIGGRGLARVYHRRPGLTAESFVPDPFAPAAGRRLYRTGDLARLLADGRIEFLGRIDHQVKVAGFRIELGEVEAALAEHPGVEAAAVTVHETAPGQTGPGPGRLVAYVAAPRGDFAPDALRRFLKSRLPDYMLPAVYVALDELPLTANGKVDRRALPAPEPVVEAGHQAPRGEVEEVIAGLWQELLAIPRIGRHDDFFALGGHSILATRFVERVREVFGVELPLSRLFEEPTVAGQATAVEALRRDGAAPGTWTALVPHPESRFEPFPLTPVQEAYWIGRDPALELGGAATHLYFELDFTHLDLPRLGRAWRRLIRRHDMLRAVIGADGRQRVLARVPSYRIAEVDLRGLGAAGMQSALEAVREVMSHQVLPSDRWPLFELCVSRLDHRLRLHVSLDLLILDAWSIQLLLSELERLYRSPDHPLPSLELSFRDYVLAQEELKRGAAYGDHLAYWRRRIGDLPPPPALPLAVSPAALSRRRFVRRSLRLESDFWQPIEVRARKQGLTPSTVLLAAFAEVLARWSGGASFTLNVTQFNRLPLHPDVDRIVGDFTTLVLLAVDREGRASFAQRARGLQRRLWTDLEHRLVSGVEVLRELARVKGEGAHAAAPVVFTSTLGQGGAGASDPLAELGGTKTYAISQTPQVWLDHQVVQEGGALVSSWDAVEELFPPGLLDAMFGAYQRLLRRLGEDGELWESLDLDLLPADQRDLLAQLNATGAPEAPGLLHGPFEAQAAAQPDATALVAGGRHVSYGALLGAAGRLAVRLRAGGAGPDRPVAVVMEKGWEEALAVVAVLRAGAPYLPVDAGLPRRRLLELLELGEVEWVVTQAGLDQRLDGPAGVERLKVEDGLLARPPAADAGGDAPSPAAATNLAYVLFTSGSTGKPKGVMIDHRGALNTVVDVNRRFGVGPSDRVLALSSLSFDLSVYDLFGLLAAGGTVVFPRAASLRDPAHLLATVQRERLTIWSSVPALMAMLVELAEVRSPRPCLPLRLVMLSGDWIPLTLPDRVRAVANDGVEVISLGGATEASIWSILHPLSEVPPGWTSVPYGRPMDNQRFHVLDRALEPCPVWVPGQLYISGVGLARGYWREPERSRASFFEHPRTGERLYRTGDLGRLRPDGNIEFLGREDFQVKVQGYRIELGEIEAALLDHPDVQAAVAAAVGERFDNKRLAAYVVPASSGGVDAEAVRSFIAARLPGHMVPSRLMVLDSLPLNATGKVDRKALPDAFGEATPAERTDRTPAGEGVPPELEERMADLIGELLGVEPPAPETDLLALGANSVDLIRIANAFETHLDFRPRLDELYRRPTIAGLVEAYRSQGPGPAVTPPAGAERWVVGPPLDPAAREEHKRRRLALRRDPAREEWVLERSAGPAAELARSRRSHRSFLSRPITGDQIGRLLSCLAQVEDGAAPRFLYPSAGGLYPIQTYLHVRPGRAEGLKAGSYYYDPVHHRLELLAAGVDLAGSIHSDLVNRPIYDGAAFSLFLVAEAAAIAPIYGRLARDFCLLEAGAMLQMLMMQAADCELGLCPIGEVESGAVRGLLELSPSQELVHSLVGGTVLTTSRAEEVGRRPVQAAPPVSVPPVDLPLSFAQQRLWFLDRLEPGNPAYNMCEALEIEGRLDVRALQLAVGEVLRRHQATRATFADDGGKPVLAFRPPAPVRLPAVDLSRIARRRRGELYRRLIKAEALRSFDLSRGPLLRCAVLRLDDRRWGVLFNLHHIVGDVWSMGILFSEVAAAYRAFSQGRPPELPRLPIQYVDFARRQRRELSEERLDSLLGFWRRKLADAPPPLALPTRHAAGGAVTPRGASRRFLLPAAETTALVSLGRRRRATTFVTLLAAFKAFLYGLTGQEDVVVGTPFTNRDRAETEPLIGFFVDTLVMRSDLSGDPPFVELLERVREVALEAFAHRDLPFERLVEALGLDRSADRSPLFRVWFVLQNVPRPSPEMPGLEVCRLALDAAVVRHDLKCEITEAPEGLAVELSYRRDLFDERTAEWMMEGLEAVLRQVAAASEERLSILGEQVATAARRGRVRERESFQAERLRGLSALRPRSRAGRDPVPGTEGGR